MRPPQCIALLALLSSAPVHGAHVVGTLRRVEFVGAGHHHDRVLAVEHSHGGSLLRGNQTLQRWLGATVEVDGTLRGTYIDPSHFGILDVAPRVDAAVEGSVKILHIATPLPTTAAEWGGDAFASAFRVGSALDTIANGKASMDITSVLFPISQYATCDFVQLMQDALDGLGHMQLETYDHVAITMPREFGGTDTDGKTTCTVGGGAFLGVAFVGGRYSWTRASDGDFTHTHEYVMTHELGHNFGLGHSGSLTDEYGDRQCTMGGGQELTGGTFGGPMIQKVGWGTTNSTGSVFRLRTLAAYGDVAQYGQFVISFRGSTGHDAHVAARYQGVMIIHKLTESGDTVLLHAGNTRYRHDGIEFAPALHSTHLMVGVHERGPISGVVTWAIGGLTAGVLLGLQVRGHRMRGRRAERLAVAARKKTSRLSKTPSHLLPT